MGEPLSREAFARIHQQVIASAPAGLTREQFQAQLDSAIQEAERGSAPPAERTFRDTAIDALPLAGGIVGGIVGTPGGIPGIMAGSAIGGGLGEAARQTARGEALDAGDIASTAIGEGLTAGAGGLAVKGGVRLIRGISRMGIRPGDVAKGTVKSLVSREMPVIGAVRRSIEDESASRLARETLGSGRLNTSRLDKLDDILQQALEETRGANTAGATVKSAHGKVTGIQEGPSKIGGSGRQLRGGQNRPVVNPERGPGGMISTQPDKFGATSIHQPDVFIDRTRIVDKARPVATPPPASQAALADDAVTRFTQGSSTLRPSEQELLRELMRAESLAQPAARGLTKTGRSILSADDAAALQRIIDPASSHSLTPAEIAAARARERFGRNFRLE